VRFVTFFLSNFRLGYVVLYTEDKNRTDALWQALAVKGDNHSSIIYDLKPFTVYYFKVQARNSRGYGPFSNIITFRTGQSKFSFRLFVFSLTTDVDRTRRQL